MSISTRNTERPASELGGRNEIFPVPVNIQLFGSVIGSTVRIARTFFSAQPCSAEFSHGIGIGIVGPCALADAASVSIAARTSWRMRNSGDRLLRNASL